MTPLGDAAVKLGLRRLRVFPCWPRRKEPAIRDNLRLAACDEAIIRKFWGEQGQYNIAIACGPGSGIWATEEGLATMSRLEAEYGKLPKTVEVVTGGGGRHLYWNWPNNGVEIRNFQVRDDLPGLDVRGEGGYVLAPPSIHPSGRAYAWSVDSASEIAYAPEWLLRVATERSARRSSGNGPATPKEWEALLSQAHEGSHRAAFVARVFGHFVRKYSEPAVAFAAVEALDEKWCTPPLGHDEVLRICRDRPCARLRALRCLRYAQYLSLATGRALTGEHVHRRCRVLVVSLEDNDEELRRRILAARIHHNVSLEEVRGWLFLSAPGARAGKLLAINRRGRAELGTLAATLETAIIRRKIDLLALDPFVKAHAVTENDNNLIDQVAQVLVDLAAKHDIAVDVPHHVRKSTPEPGNADRGRGASAARDASRLIYSLTVMTTQEAEMFGVSEQERRLYFRVDSAKVNIAPPALTAKWFKLIGVRLDNATDLYPNGDEVQTVQAWTPPAAFDALDIAICNRILDTIKNGLADGERFSDANAAKTRAAWKAVKIHAPDKTEAQCKEIIRQWVKNGVLVAEVYYSDKERKDLSGLRVNNAARPGTKREF